MNTFLLFLSVLVPCSIFAMLWGAAPERWAAGLQLLAFALGFGWWTRLLVPARLVAPFFTIDLALLLALTALAIRSRRFWPIWVAGFQCAAVFTHLTKGLVPQMVPQGYSILLQLWGYPMLMLTAVGTWRHQRRLRLGPDPSWKKRAKDD